MRVCVPRAPRVRARWEDGAEDARSTTTRTIARGSRDRSVAISTMRDARAGRVRGRRRGVLRRGNFSSPASRSRRARARASSTRRPRRGRGIGSSPRARTFAGDEERLAARAPRNERATTDDARATNERQIHQARRRSRGFERIRRKGVQGRALPRRRRRRARAGAWRAFARERYDRDTMMGGLERVRGDDATRVRGRRRERRDG